jgi:hypothetical protein
MRIVMNKFKAALCVVAFAMTAPALAHHSFAGYDMTKTVTAKAVLKEFRWGAPHSTAVFTIKGSDGKDVDVTIASATPAMFVKQGFAPRDFKAGEEMEVAWHPAANGNLGGALALIRFHDGRTFNDTEFQGILKQDAGGQAATAK